MATNIISALGAGSGVDVKALAQGLVDVEKQPREDAINAKIDTQERRISGYSALMLSLGNVKTAFQKLNDLNDFNASTVVNSEPTIVSAVTTSAAVPGRHSVEVQRLASLQRDASNSFSSKTQSLNSGNAFSITLTLDGDAQNSIRVATATPQGIVDAINDSAQGVTAQLIDTGDASNPYKIVLAGPMGAEGTFSYTSDDASGGTPRTDTLTFQAATATGTITVAGVSVDVTAGQTATEVAEAVRVALAASDFITGVSGRGIATGSSAGELDLTWVASDGSNPLFASSDPDSTGATVAATVSTAFVSGSAVSGLDLAETSLTSAADALVVINGLSVTRSSNVVDDVIPGVYLDLLSADVGNPAEITVRRDTAVIKENLNAVVTAYNDAMSDIAILKGERSDDPEDVYSGSLRGDSQVRRIEAQLRQMFMADSSTPGDNLTAFRDLGLDIDKTGVMSIDSTELDAALTDNFDDVVMLFSANTNNQTELGVANRGIAGDAVKAINDLIGTRGTIATQSAASKTRIVGYEAKLEELDTRMTALLARYTQQFSLMESLVGQTNSMRESLKSSFEGMMAMYTKK